MVAFGSLSVACLIKRLCLSDVGYIHNQQAIEIGLQRTLQTPYF